METSGSFSIKKDSIVYKDKQKKFRIVSMSSDYVTMVGIGTKEIQLKSMPLEQLKQERWQVHVE